MDAIVFIDAEINPQTGRLSDLGAVKPDKSKFHSGSQDGFSEFLSGADFICGHNIFAHDLKYIGHLIPNRNNVSIIDTLYLSPLLFPNRPHHALLKDDKLQADELNNPLNDSIKAMELFFDEVNAFQQLKSGMKNIYFSLLSSQKQFSGFFTYVDYQPAAASESVLKKAISGLLKYMNSQSAAAVEAAIKAEFAGKICAAAGLLNIIERHPVELAYCLALISADDRYSLTPPWILRNFPKLGNVMKLLRNTPCAEGCAYCDGYLDVRKRMKEIFGFDEFRTYGGEPLQENAAKAAVKNRSLLAVFPTGGGKSITFQLPALIAGEAERGLTVVISPLQSLMKDQVDNLAALGISDAVTINGLLSPIERAEAFERAVSGRASLLYISPESLRSGTIEKLLLSRNVVRFVIDEAHCFSSWGQDFRVDYLYIGDFIKELQEKKNLGRSIPVSCFTATAKQKVISDIRDYFRRKLNIELELYATGAERSNLRYEVLHTKSDDEKYAALRDLISQKNCPTIVYVSRVKRAFSIARQLAEDGFSALPFNGRMPSGEKIANQEAFISGAVQIMVATSAFGMGVDKKDVQLVVHYDISDSLENYVQEAGRAGRDQSLQAECYVLFSAGDLDKHFILLNQTKISIKEIQQIWKAIKDLTKTRDTVRRSPLEIARQAGWDDTVYEIETRVKTAVAALEAAGYITRGKNYPRVFATGILADNMMEASDIIHKSDRFNDAQKQNASRILSLLFSKRSIAAARDEGESRVDYISDVLGLSKEDVISSINLMREVGLLADSKDLTAYIRKTEKANKSLSILQRYVRLEKFLIPQIMVNMDDTRHINLKELNDRAIKAGLEDTSVPSIINLLYYWSIRGFIKKSLAASKKRIEIMPQIAADLFEGKFMNRVKLARFIVDHLYKRKIENPDPEKEEVHVQFSVLDLKKGYDNDNTLFKGEARTAFDDIEDALLYLAKINSLNLDGGFLVLYNAMEIQRLKLDNRIRYKLDDYKQLDDFYQHKVEQIHIVGEYANMITHGYDKALQFVKDYFQTDYRQFISKYFQGARLDDIKRNITPDRYQQLFGTLSNVQREIIDDGLSKYIVVAAGPGSGKTRVLVHKLAALMQLEDVKHEQLLMLTFSRAAATEFKKRLLELIGNAANFIEIKTFHSYCFDLLGKVGNLRDSNGIVKNAVAMIESGEVEITRITKTVAVIDEAQDMDGDEFALIKALMDRNEDMRVIAVGDDDQNIYEFRGSSSEHMKSFITAYGAGKYDLLENYRSRRNIVEFTNAFAETLSQRIKSEPVQAVQQDGGVVKLIGHKSKNLEIPIVNNIKATRKDGTACILTNTNDEALRVMGLLTKEGLGARLIQENTGFNLYDLAEFRYFIKVIDGESASPVISDKAWESAKKRLQSAYSRSECLNICCSLLDEFEWANSRKYRSDLEIFIRESRFEDFYKFRRDEIVVSTIHKSKGREFDSVYMLMNHVRCDSDEDKRKIYVGLTRAKNELYIHCNNNCFDKFDVAGMEKLIDDTEYPEPEEIVTPLSHRDVNLGFFKDKKDAILNLKSGFDGLIVKGNSLFLETSNGLLNVLIFSKKYQETMNTLRFRGYAPYKAKVRFVVAWKGEEDEHESAVLLPDVYFKKGDNSIFQ